MFDEKALVGLIDVISEIGVAYTEEKIEYATLGEPPFIKRTFAYDIRADIYVKALLHHIKSDEGLASIFCGKQYNYGTITKTIHP